MKAVAASVASDRGRVGIGRDVDQATQALLQGLRGNAEQPADVGQVVRDGGVVLGLAIAVLGFLWVAYLAFANFNEARQGRAEWAEVGVLGIVGAVVLIFASDLLTEAAGGI